MEAIKDIGFIGLGVMGEPMCRNLARKSGLKVGLLESGPLCEGVTGHTTAKLTSQHGGWPTHRR